MQIGNTTYKPHPGKQTEFLESTCDWIFFGGARGGSKSFSLTWKAAYMPRKWHFEYKGKEIEESEYYDLKSKRTRGLEIKIDRVSVDYPDYIALLVRRTFPQLERNLKPECNKLYKMYGAKWQERNHCYLFPSGAKVYLVHFKDEKSKDNYIGGNYNFLGIDEANQFPEHWVTEISTSVRSNNPEIKPQICLTSNPGNVGHVWLKRQFVDKCTPIPDGDPVFNEEFNVSYQPTKTAAPYYDDEGISYQYIPATVFDNPTLIDSDKAYVKKLKNLNPVLRAMWLEGKWDVFQGMYFDQWNILHHVMIREDFVFGTNFSKKTHSLYRFYDYGTKAPFVCLFAAIDEDKNVIIFDEIAKTGLSASKQAEHVNHYTWEKYKLKPEDFDDDIADPAYWTKHSEKEGILYSLAMFYADAGIYLSKGNNDRKAKAKIVYDGLDIPDGEGAVPKIRFTDNCEYCIETIPNLPSAENDPEDVDTKAEDHAFDALAYGATVVLEPSIYVPEHKKGWRQKIADYSQSIGSGGWMSA